MNPALEATSVGRWLHDTGHQLTDARQSVDPHAGCTDGAGCAAPVADFDPACNMEPPHDDHCESEFIEGPMTYSPCGCATRRYVECTIHDHSGPVREDFIDFPTGWRIQCEGLTHTDERCSAVQTNGAMLCDCPALRAEWERRVARQSVDQEAHRG